jgi:RNA polymerase sigma factor (sigma-70 family)
MKVCGQRQDAEDTMQEVLLQSVPALSKFDSPKALMVWLYKVAKSRCLMSRRKSKFAPKEALSLEQLMPDRQELEGFATTVDRTPESALLRRENAKLLRQAVQKLPPEYRLILVLHDMEEPSCPAKSGIRDSAITQAGSTCGSACVCLTKLRPCSSAPAHSRMVSDTIVTTSKPASAQL